MNGTEERKAPAEQEARGGAAKPPKQAKKPKRKNPFRFAFYDFVKITGILPGLLWFRVKVLYTSDAAKKRPKGGFVLVSNHTGFADPIVAMLAMPARRITFLARKMFFEGNPIKRAFFRGVHCIPVDTENPGISSLKDVAAALKNGQAVLVFPEGHVSFGSKEMDTFKSGAVMMAAMGRTPIVPMYILPRGKWYRRQVVVIGERIEEPVGGMLPLPQIEEITCRLQEKEYQFREIAEGWKNK